MRFTERGPSTRFGTRQRKYLREQVKKTLWRDAISLEQAETFIGDLDVSQVHIGTLVKFIEHRGKKVTVSTVNRDLCLLVR